MASQSSSKLIPNFGMLQVDSISERRLQPQSGGGITVKMKDYGGLRAALESRLRAALESRSYSLQATAAPAAKTANARDATRR